MAVYCIVIIVDYHYDILTIIFMLVTMSICCLPCNDGEADSIVCTIKDFMMVSVSFIVKGVRRKVM